MKKIFFTIVVVTILFITGCQINNKDKVKEKFINNVKSLEAYYIEGKLSMLNNEDIYNYDVTVSYKKKDNFKVTLKNNANNYEQTILRNNEAVYVITPSINKTFKFQSKWPYNNSQSYLLNSLTKDLEEDKEFTMLKENNSYILINKVKYQNNPNIAKEKIYLDKDYNLQKVEVLDDNDIKLIEFVVNKYDGSPNYKEDYFELKEEINNSEENSEVIEDNKNNNQSTCTDNNQDCNKTNIIDETLFPLYIPENTNLSNKEVINKDDGQRVIMTFSGDSPFILVQETITKNEENTIIPTYGDPFMLKDTIGSLTDISYSWISNGIEYYIVSDVMSQNELLNIASSVNIVSTINEK